MKRIIIFGCIGVLFLVGLISTTIFAVLYLNSQNEIKVKNAELASCNTDKVIPTEVTCPTPTTGTTENTFIDNGQSIEVRYPTSWTGVLTTNITDDYAYEPEYGRVITKYDYTLTKSGTSLKFSRIMGAVDGFPSGLKVATHDWFEIPGTDVLRYSDKDQNVWQYVSKIDCAEIGEPFFTPVEVASFGVCIASFFPGFGVSGASVATINSLNATILGEADLIVKSALN